MRRTYRYGDIKPETLEITMGRRKIIKNAIKCVHCGDIIESKHVHDFVECQCGAVYVDGGHEYLRRGFNNRDDYIELSQFQDDDSDV